MRSWWLLLALLLMTENLIAGTLGSFRGTIVENPDSSAYNNWIYVQSRNGTARRVDISRAHISYDEDVPAAERSAPPSDALKPGTEVRITAEQGSDGEWKASRVEILKPAVSTQPKRIGR